MAASSVVEISNSKKGKLDGKGDNKKPDSAAVQTRPKYEFKMEDLSASQNRWVIPPQSSLLLVVRFSTKKPGVFEGKLEFESFFS